MRMRVSFQVETCYGAGAVKSSGASFGAFDHCAGGPDELALAVISSTAATRLDAVGHAHTGGCLMLLCSVPDSRS